MTWLTFLETANAALAQCAFDDWKLVAKQDGEHGVYLQVRATTADATTGESLEWGGRKWRLSVHMTKSEIVQTALMAVLAAVEHEARERFLYKGKPIFGPHHDVDALVGICERRDAR